MAEPRFESTLDRLELELEDMASTMLFTQVVILRECELQARPLPSSGLRSVIFRTHILHSRTICTQVTIEEVCRDYLQKERALMEVHRMRAGDVPFVACVRPCEQ